MFRIQISDEKMKDNLFRILKNKPRFIQQSTAKLALDTTAAVMLRTPVFTGRLRSGWQPVFTSIGMPGARRSAPSAKRQGVSLKKGRVPSPASAMEGGKGGSTAFASKTPSSYKVTVINAVQYVGDVNRYYISKKGEDFIGEPFHKAWYKFEREFRANLRDYAKGK